MGKVLGRLKKGDLLISGKLNERLPAITDGLIAHMPMDGTCMDIVGGHNPVEATETRKNLILDCSQYDWRDPNSWEKNNGDPNSKLTWDSVQNCLVADGEGWWLFKGFIQVDTSKNWYFLSEVKKEGTKGVYYMGNASFKADKTTGVPGHPGSYDYAGACSVTVPVTWTKYLNQYTDGAPRTGTSTAGLANTFDPDCRFIRPVFIANYNGGVIGTDKTYIKNIAIYYTDKTTPGVVKKNDGVAICRTTTNLIPNPHKFSSGWNSYGEGNDGAFMTEFGIEGVNIINRKSWCGTSRAIQLPSAGTYTFSALVKIIDIGKFSGWIGIYISGGGIEDKSSFADPSVIGKWQKITLTVTTTTNNIMIYLMGAGGDRNDINRMTCQYTMPQVEALPYATEFVNGARSNDAALRYGIPNAPNLTKYTVRLDYSHPDLSKFGTNAVFASSYDGINGGSAPWFGVDANTNNVRNAPSQANKRHTALFVYDGSITHVYIDGNLVCDSGGKFFFATNYIISFSSVFGWNSAGYLASFKIHTLSIYNRALSANEIKKLSSRQQMSIVKSGDLITNRLVERPNGVTPDMFHFPLKCDSYDDHHMVKASVEQNVTYENGSCYSGGGGVANLFKDVPLKEYAPGSFFAGDWGISGDTVTWSLLSTPYKKGVRVKRVTGGGDWQLAQSNIDFVAGVTYTLSFMVKDLNGDGKTPPASFNIGPWGINGIFYDNGVVTTNLFALPKKYIPYPDGWFKVYGTFTCTVSGRSPAAGVNSVGSNQDLIFAQPFLGQSCFPVPYTPSTKSMSLIGYNLNQSIGLDWSKDWSIVMFRKPNGTASHDYTGYSLFSFGCNGNNNGGYLWIGKNAGQNIISSSGFAQLDNQNITQNYFNNWHMVSIVKKGASATLIFWNCDGVPKRTVTASLAIPTANYYVTQYGYDLNIGGWDNLSQSETYVKDLIVAKRALSDGELKTINSTFMRNKNTHTQVQGRLKERYIL